MATSMLETIRASLKAKLDESRAKAAELDGLLAAPKAEARDLNDDEAARFADLRDAVKALDDEVNALRAREAELADIEARNAEREKLAREIQPEESSTGFRQAMVRNEPKAYEAGGASFLADAYAAHRGMARGHVAERLNRHDNEVRAGAHGAEHRDVDTGDLGGMVVPQYLTDMYAEVLRAGRVTSNVVASPPLAPEGEVLVIPRGTTGSTVAAQSGQNTTVSEQDVAITNLTVPVRTYAGMQDLSRQSLERGRNIDTLVWNDLAGAYSVSLNTDVINGAGTNGTHTGLLSSSLSTVTATSTGAAHILGKIAQAIGEVNESRFSPATVIVMAPRRWAHLTGAADGNLRPLVVPRAGGPMNALGMGDAASYGYVGEIHGLPVYTDGCIPTTISTGTAVGATEDRIFVMRNTDNLLWEENVAPRRIRFDETLSSTLTVKLVTYGYSAFTAQWHPEGTCIIAGTGLTTPTF